MFVPPMSMASVKGGAPPVATGLCSEELELTLDIRNDPSLCRGAGGAGAASERRDWASRSRTPALFPYLLSRRVPLWADLGCLDNLLPYAVHQLHCTISLALLNILGTVRSGRRAAGLPAIRRS